jgi:hypothetical protein
VSTPAARYAGVLLWRALVDERAMPPAVALPRAGEPAREMYAGPYRFRQGLYDVHALTMALAAADSPGAVPGALARYERARLGAAIRHVAGSEQETAAYLAHAAARSTEQ